MNILVINAGSSSVKFGVFNLNTGEQVYKHKLERLQNVSEAIEQIPSLLQEAGITGLDAVGHRVVHGGDKFQDACVIDDEVVGQIEACVPLAPLHNPANLQGIQVARSKWADIPHVAVFDTCFHQNMPECAFTYAVPQEWRDSGLRRYGFHGTSHKYVSLNAAQAIGKSADELRIITCHLGNGASVCAVDRGVSVDTSMGMTALEGLVMGSRSGDVDPGVFSFLQREKNLSPDQVEAALYKQSGLSALSGLGNDMRDIEAQAAEGNEDAQLAIDVFVYRARKYIGAYTAAMGGVDLLVFTGGMGENSAQIRKRICDRFEYLGLYFNNEKNQGVTLENFDPVQLQHDHSRVKVMAMKTREQWMIAQETQRVASASLPKAEGLSIPIGISARHVHLDQETVEILFGEGHQLTKLKDLSQPGVWAAEETVDVIGPKGEIGSVRILGPCRGSNQVEISKTDTYKLGIDAPLRLSGDNKNTPTVLLRGPKTTFETGGIIIAKRHVHMSTEDANAYGFKHKDMVEVVIDSEGRDLVFRDVVVRVRDSFLTEMHIDTDEANAAHFKVGGEGELVRVEKTASITGVSSKQVV